MKRILQVIDDLGSSGAARQLALLVAGLPRERFECHVCTLTSGPAASDFAGSCASLTTLPRRAALDPHAWWRLRQLIVRLRPDMVQAWGGAANVYAWLAARSCGVPDIRILHRHVGLPSNPSEALLERLLARRSAALVVNSPALAELYRQHGIAAEKLRVVPSAVVPVDPPGPRDQLLRELGLPPGDCPNFRLGENGTVPLASTSQRVRLVGLVGPLVSRKRVKDAIWAADLLKVIRDDVHLLIFGDGPQHERLLRFRRQAEIEDKVHFLGDRPDARRWMAYLDLFWSTSQREGQSSAILEAMVAGVPVIATDIPGTRDLVVEGVTGHLVPVGDRAELARRTQQLLESPDIARSMGESGRRRALEQFGVEAMVERYVEGLGG